MDPLSPLWIRTCCFGWLNRGTLLAFASVCYTQIINLFLSPYKSTKSCCRYIIRCNIHRCQIYQVWMNLLDSIKAIQLMLIHNKLNFLFITIQTCRVWLFCFPYCIFSIKITDTKHFLCAFRDLASLIVCQTLSITSTVLPCNSYESLPTVLLILFTCSSAWSVDNWLKFCLLVFTTKIVSEDDQEKPQSQTADNPMAPRGRATPSCLP